jgi:small neutral amino acid transporter SnatA (MarC family)
MCRAALSTQAAARTVNTDFVHTVLLAIGALLPLVDPLGSAPIYQRLRSGLHRDARPALALLVYVCYRYAA